MDEPDFDFKEKSEHQVTVPESFPPWAPVDVVQWLRANASSWPARMTSLYVTLVTDARMQEVWNWYTSAVNDKGFRFCFLVGRCSELPSFPGNLQESERNEYLAKVRKHAEALVELLAPTEYGSNSTSVTGISMVKIEDEALAKTVTRDLANWGDDETGHVVAYYVDEDGVSRLPWHYPESTLCDLLWDVIGWTTIDDYWDLLRSSKAIERAKGENRHAAYFVRNLYDKLSREGFAIPFAKLATVANVALGLAEHVQADEDSVRKQVRRYKPRPPREHAF